MSSLKHLVMRWTPPVLVDFLKVLRGKVKPEYEGNFPNWDLAVKHTGAYDAAAIFDRVKEARLKVLRGEAVYERDGKTFAKPQYFWPVLTSLLLAETKNGEKLNVLDFGGSLGTSYFQHKQILDTRLLRWNIVEQKHFVEFGRENIHEEGLYFYESLEACLVDTKPNVFFISSALQYLPEPYSLLTQVKKARFSYIIFDRTTILEKGLDRITAQNVPKKIYPVSFPAWFFNEKKFIDFFLDEYKLKFDFPSIGDPIALDTGTARNKGYCFERINTILN